MSATIPVTGGDLGRTTREPVTERRDAGYGSRSMTVTATFMPGSISVAPGSETPLALTVHNDEDERRVVSLEAVGDLADGVRLGLTSLSLEPDETFEIPVTVAVTPTVPPGLHRPEVRISADNDGAVPVVAAVSMEVMSVADHTVALDPVASKGARRGRHTVRVTNSGNEEVTVGVHPDHLDSAISLDSEPAVTVPPGRHADVTLTAVPSSTYWNGPSVEHPFAVTTTGSDGRSFELAGTYVQRPRMPAWLGPALAGAAMALLIGAIVWFAFARPWVEDTAEQAADDAIEADREALRERIVELEEAAAEAEELPLGTPTDLRLDVAAAGGNIGAARETVPAGSTVSITDVVFQNPTGAVGTVRLTRDGDVLLESELANFRDLDLHFVAPYTVAGGSEIALELDCRTPGPGVPECTVGASLVGFVD